MSSNRVRIDLPTNPEDRITLAKAIAGKHAELGNASPLGQLKWDKITPNLALAEAKHRDAKRNAAQAEADTQTRDAALEIVTTFLLRAGRDVLSGVYPDEMRKLGEFGFTVTAASRASKDTPEQAAKPTG